MSNPVPPARRTDTAAAAVSMDPAAESATPGLALLSRLEVLILALATAALPVLVDLGYLTTPLSADIGGGLLILAAGLHLPGVVVTTTTPGRRTRGG